jgi:large subunit ribosomal protein L3
MSFLLARKVAMTQLWVDDAVVPVTELKVPAITVSQIKAMDKDGYTAVQVNDGKVKREFRTDDTSTFEVGAAVSLDQFQEGDKIKIAAYSKGRGFQGVVKRHGFAGVGMASHGQKNRQRHPGSIGSTAPQRVVPGRKMAGRMGNERNTISGIKIIKIDAENGALFIKGAVPGARGALVEIRDNR